MVTQCHNCPMWGHVTSNCDRPPKYLKCAGDHLTRTCTKSRDQPAKCAIFRDDHSANYSKCQRNIKRVERLEENRKKPEPKKYVQALPPKESIWTSRSNPQDNIRPIQRGVFLELSRRGSGTRGEVHPSWSHPRSQAHLTYKQQHTKGSMDEFQELNNEFDESNRLANLSELKRTVRELISQLRT